MTKVADTIGHALRSTAAVNRDAIAIVDGEQRLTFGQFDALVDDLARSLASLGVRGGDHVAVWMTNCTTWAAVLGACARIGAVLIPVNTRLKSEEVEYILRQSDSTVLLMMDNYWSIDYFEMLREIVPELPVSSPGNLSASRLPALRAVVSWNDSRAPGIMTMSEFVARGKAESLAGSIDANVDPASPVLVVYTSGTTGYPKGAMHSHALLKNAANIGRSLHMEPGNVILGHMPFYHIAGPISGILPMMAIGCKLVIMDQWKADDALVLMVREDVTHFSGIPTHFIDLLAAHRRNPCKLPSLKTSWIGGAAVTPDVVSAMHDELGFKRLQAIYGMTETMGATVVSGFDDPLSIACENKGRIIGDYEIRIVDPRTGAAYPEGAVGEVLVRGEIVMLGYYKRPEETAEAIDADGWFHTGDLGWVSLEGYLQVTGRLKDMFIVGGSNVYPSELERILQGHPAIKQAAVVGVPDPRLGEVGFAFVQLENGSTLNTDELQAFCRSNMADYKVPRHFRLVDEFPLTATNKIQRFMLSEEASRSVAAK